MESFLQCEAASHEPKDDFARQQDLDISSVDLADAPPQLRPRIQLTAFARTWIAKLNDRTFDADDNPQRRHISERCKIDSTKFRSTPNMTYAELLVEMRHAVDADPRCRFALRGVSVDANDNRDRAIAYLLVDVLDKPPGVCRHSMQVMKWMRVDHVWELVRLTVMRAPE